MSRAPTINTNSVIVVTMMNDRAVPSPKARLRRSIPMLTVMAHVISAGTKVPLGFVNATTTHDEAAAMRNGAAVNKRPLIEFASA